MERMAGLLAAALVRPKRRIATRPTRGSQRRRIDEKRQRGEQKRLRQDKPKRD
jgi:ribosome-associated protein